jgi:predicted dehydrogenase
VISCERGSISYNLLTDDPDYDVNDSYVEEMETFLNCVREGKVRHEHDAWRATQSLAIAASALEAARTNATVEIPAWVRSL